MSTNNSLLEMVYNGPEKFEDVAFVFTTQSVVEKDKEKIKNSVGKADFLEEDDEFFTGWGKLISKFRIYFISLHRENKEGEIRAYLYTLKHIQDFKEGNLIVSECDENDFPVKLRNLEKLVLNDNEKLEAFFNRLVKKEKNTVYRNGKDFKDNFFVK